MNTPFDLADTDFDDMDKCKPNDFDDSLSDDDFNNDSLDDDGLDNDGLDDNGLELDHDWDNEPSAIAPSTLCHTIIADDKAVGVRLDKFCAEYFADFKAVQFSRSQIQGFIQDGALTVNDAPQKAKYLIKAGDAITLNTPINAHSEDMPEAIALDIIYEDDTVLVVNKPANLVVHPGAGNSSGTLVNGLLYHDNQLKNLPRAGLVHRIDKDTTGLMVIAKTKAAQLSLIHQLKDKTVYRHYQCVVTGTPDKLLAHKIINLPIARHPTYRTKMAVRDNGKPAVTHIAQVTALNTCHSLVHVMLETGRTHQIRVHLTHIGCPLVGDKVYGNPPKKSLPAPIYQKVAEFDRQALHAYELGFVHPKTGQAMTFTAPLPDDMTELIQDLTDN